MKPSIALGVPGREQVMARVGEQVRVAEHDPLGRAGRATGVGDRRQCALIELGRLRAIAVEDLGVGDAILLPRFAADRVAETIRRETITHTVLVPTMLGMLLDHLDASEPGQRLDSLRHIQYAASPISAELQRRVLERFDDCDIAQFYGMTEAAPTVSHLPAIDHRRGVRGEEPYASRLRSIGAPVVGVQAEVRGPGGEQLPAGEIGELWVRGPNVMLGYWNRPEATEIALADGWYHSSDAARADGDGYLYLVDRLKDMIITGGENVYSIEVESALLVHEAVLEAAVFGIPHPQWGEAVQAIVTVQGGSTVTGADLIALPSVDRWLRGSSGDRVAD